MRYMIIVKGSYEDEINYASGPTDDMLVEMGKFNKELMDAGVMLAGEGLQPSKTGANVRFAKGKPPTVKDGPFTEAKELVGGFWIIKADSLEEALGWAKKIPFDCGRGRGAPRLGDGGLRVQREDDRNPRGRAALPRQRQVGRNETR